MRGKPDICSLDTRRCRVRGPKREYRREHL